MTGTEKAVLLGLALLGLVFALVGAVAGSWSRVVVGATIAIGWLVLYWFHLRRSR